MKPEKNMVSDMEVFWSAQAKITYFRILDYLNEHWSKKEIIQFSRKTDIIIQAIRRNPEIYPVTFKHKEIRKAIVDKNNSFYYKADKLQNRIYLLTFYDNRQDPEKLVFEIPKSTRPV
jgi:hypothetical protein